MNPNPSVKEQIDAVLYEHGADLTDVRHIKIREALLNIIEKDVIGEDEPEYSLGNPNWGKNRQQNALRESQREKLK